MCKKNNNHVQVILAKPRAEVSKKGEAYRKWLCHIQFNLSVILLFYWDLYFCTKRFYCHVLENSCTCTRHAAITKSLSTCKKTTKRTLAHAFFCHGLVTSPCVVNSVCASSDILQTHKANPTMCPTTLRNQCFNNPCHWQQGLATSHCITFGFYSLPLLNLISCMLAFDFCIEMKDPCQIEQRNPNPTYLQISTSEETKQLCPSIPLLSGIIAFANPSCDSQTSCHSVADNRVKRRVSALYLSVLQLPTLASY